MMTCAALGNVFWNYRMFLLEPRAVYFDWIERTLLNVALSAINLEGNKYFYENMLRRTKKLDYELCWPLHRTESISSFCCPPNLMRTIAESAQYAYTLSEDAIWTGLYGDCEAKITLENSTFLCLHKERPIPMTARSDSLRVRSSRITRSRCGCASQGGSRADVSDMGDKKYFADEKRSGNLCGD